MHENVRAFNILIASAHITQASFEIRSRHDSEQRADSPYKTPIIQIPVSVELVTHTRIMIPAVLMASEGEMDHHTRRLSFKHLKDRMDGLN